MAPLDVRRRGSFEGRAGDLNTLEIDLYHAGANLEQVEAYFHSLGADFEQRAGDL